eukprot:m51a1_g578 hypothetical protein (303) ;mRNA; f:550608-551516
MTSKPLWALLAGTLIALLVVNMRYLTCGVGAALPSSPCPPCPAATLPVPPKHSPSDGRTSERTAPKCQGDPQRTWEFAECLEKASTYRWVQQGNNLKQPGAWNDKQRWEGLDELGLRAPCVIVEFGMNNGLDTRDLLRKTPCKIYTYELLPRFVRNAHFLKNNDRVVAIPFGISDVNTTFLVEDAGIATGLNPLTQQGKGVEVSTRDVVSEMYRLFGSDPHWTVDLLHSNCEGCEYSVFDMLHKHGLLSRFSVLQFGTHHPRPGAGVTDPVARWCFMHQYMQKTHDLCWGIPGSWERWVRHP